MKHLLKCQLCGKYTMQESCSCGGKAVNPKPAKYAPEDPYAEWRRKAKKPELEAKGLL